MCGVTIQITIRHRLHFIRNTRVTPYVILLDSGTTVEKSYDDLIQAGRDDDPPSESPRNAAAL